MNQKQKRQYLVNQDATDLDLEEQWKLDFINSIHISELAEFVLDEYLDEFCESRAEEFREIQQARRRIFLEEV